MPSAWRSGKSAGSLETDGTRLETPSGKGADDENFPVGSFLIRPGLRRHVHVFYGFARAADDIADNPKLDPRVKVESLSRMAEIIDGMVPSGAAQAESPNAARMRESLKVTGVTPRHCLDLLKAFIQDSTKQRYADWDELLAYCYLSAAPVGRHVLDLHGENTGCRAASDALCNALQIVNHLQDCGKDYRELDRVYIPENDMIAEGASVEELRGNRLSPAMRRTLDRVILKLDELIEACRDLPRQVDDTRIALECAVIRALCVKLTRRLKTEDPLAERIVLSRPAVARLTLGALAGGLIGRIGRRAERRPAAA